jgi:vitamin B12/bleomycin/antimicrobial peptide transport system ATP-binding/permease protein
MFMTACAGHEGGRQHGQTVQYRQERQADSEDALARPVDKFHASPAATAGDRSDARALPGFQPPTIAYEGRSAVAESLALLKGLWRSGYRFGVTLLAGGILLVLIGNMVGQVRLNDWNGAFFDAIAKRNLPALGHQLLIFTGIVAFLLSLVVGQTWMQQMLKVRLREWLTRHLLDEWLARGRAYRLGLAGELGVNPDQRIEEDTRKLTDLSAGLAVGLVQASILLVSFIGILWSLSSNLVFVVAGYHFSIPGYMVWCAIAYAAIGSVMTWRIGLPLIGLNAQLYSREAELRFALVRVSESAESIALYQGEADERRQLEGNVDRVIRTMAKLTGAVSRLTWITSGYGWLAIIVPTLVASPGYFSGTLTLGGLMVVVGAFNQVQSSLRWFVDQFPSVADWRATLHRVSAFKAAMDRLDRTATRPSSTSESRAIRRASSPSTASACCSPTAASSSPRPRWRSRSASACSSSANRAPARAPCSGRWPGCGRGAPAPSCCPSPTA